MASTSQIKIKIDRALLERLEQIYKAIRKFRDAKGRHHTEIACREMLDLLPDED